MKYSITPCIEIENSKGNIIYVLTQEQTNGYYELGYKYRERRYKITTGRHDYEVVCPEIWKKGDTEHTVIIPAFLVPHRGYPLEIYVYAINIYTGDPQSNEPKKSQREAAEATKEHFGLKKFSHSTICRAMKTLTSALEGYAAACTEPAAGAQEKEDDMSGNKSCGNRFPAARDTQKRRELVGSFLQGRLDIKSRHGLMETCGRLAIWWYRRFKKLLI